MSQKDNDLQKIKQIIEIMKEHDLVEVEIAHGSEKILLKRAQDQPAAITAMPMVSAAAPAVNQVPVGSAVEARGPAADDNLVDIKSPIVGTFYATASPDSEPYVEVDSKVEPQTVVCIIEAMKVMNEIKAETSGTIAKVLVSNGQAVEYGQVLFKVKPD